MIETLTSPSLKIAVWHLTKKHTTSRSKDLKETREELELVELAEFIDAEK